MIKYNRDDQDVGYILGVPFIRAFSLFFDYDSMKVGFGNKKSNPGITIGGFKPIT